MILVTYCPSNAYSLLIYYLLVDYSNAFFQKKRASIIRYIGTVFRAGSIRVAREGGGGGGYSVANHVALHADTFSLLYRPGSAIWVGIRLTEQTNTGKCWPSYWLFCRFQHKPVWFTIIMRKATVPWTHIELSNPTHIQHIWIVNQNGVVNTIRGINQNKEVNQNSLMDQNWVVQQTGC